MQPDPFTTSRTQTVRYLDLLSRAVAHIDTHLADPLDARMLADMAAMSRYHFHRIFRAYFGTTVGGYITWRRMQRACELLARNCAPVDRVAIQVGYESAQALAKAMRRELDTTPVAVRAGRAPCWQQLFDRRPAIDPLASHNDALLKPQMLDVHALPVLTATGRGMDAGDMRRAAEQAFDELVPAIRQANLLPRTQSWLALFPDEPQGLEDQQARMLCGAVFDHRLVERSGRATQPAITLEGSLSWWHLPAGRHAVFSHRGGHSLLHRVWNAVYRDWLPATGYALRDTPSFEHYVNDPREPLGNEWRTDLYLPLQ
ncbi:GyrI-like domain-containing protein [Variovorax sp. PAMC26660]|uniref:AraC family transcriptional regulator n=1 Tax=Variovorax sp. PAMC26660 TaxID=2762322 RepID=UPI00164DED34|nr:AraC family transcriptional regulator [Variovorax sp. PAMC26660]QNK65633.1 AraC family transcriptional regulator [Variovorax sp. PAMC26660]